MTDPIASSVETAARTAALNVVNREKSWIQANAKALILGAVLGLIVGWLLHAL